MSFQTSTFVRLLNSYFKPILLLLAFATCWSIWLPYFVPIFSVSATQIAYNPGHDGEPAYIVFEAASIKYLPCDSVRTSALFVTEVREAVPIRLENYYTHKPLGQGVFSNHTNNGFTDYPLWQTVHSRVYAELPSGYNSEDVAGGYFLIHVTYHCSRLENDYDKTIIFPHNNYEAIHANVR